MVDDSAALENFMQPIGVEVFTAARVHEKGRRVHLWNFEGAMVNFYNWN